MLRLQVAHPPPSTSRICQICTPLIYRCSRPAKRSPCAAPAAGNRAITTSFPARSGRARRPQPAGRLSPLPVPGSPSSCPPASRARAGAHAPGGRAFSSASTAARSLGDAGPPQSQTPSSPAHNAAAARPPLPPLEKVLAPVLRVKKGFLAQAGIPTERSTLDALRTCDEAARLLRGAAIPPQLSALEQPSSSSTSALLSLDGSRGASPAAAAAAMASAGDSAAGGARAASPRFASSAPAGSRQALGPSPSPRQSQADFADPPTTSQTSPSRQLNSAIDNISETAYGIVSLPAVFITPKILGLYVGVQSRLGRPETLPEVLSMYASKPVPQAHGTAIRYLKQSPSKPANAVAPSVAETALDAAIEARHLDAAVAIIDSAYATKAFVRSKLLRRALVPASCFVALPVCLYVVASGISHLQHTMDRSTATAIAFAGFTTYVGFTSVMGLLASATSNDHMKRVTWAPGTPLTQRWIREEERAALDRVACSFGFSEPHRYGEEEGAEFEALREYILRKGMILDQVELMEGMGQ